MAMARSRRDSVWKYCWGLLMVLCRTAISRSIVLEPIYWNSSNSKFLPGQGLVLYPQIGDKLDIICPKVDSKTVGQYEYYKVYMVDKDQADRCTIKKENTPLLNCARPDQDVKFTIKFQEFSPNLWGLEFQKNKDYYIISTSNGSLEGLDNQEGGVCQTRAMKILMKVGQDASSAGSARNHGPTRRPELEAGTNGRSSTTSPFVKPNPGSSTDGNSAGHSGNNLLGSEVALFAGIASGCIIFIVIIITLVVLLLKYRRRHRKHSPQHTTTLSLSTLATPKRGGNNNGSEPSDVIIPLRTADSPWVYFKSLTHGARCVPLIPAPGRQNKVDLHEFKATLDYRVNSRTTRTQRALCIKQTNKQTNKTLTHRPHIMVLSPQHRNLTAFLCKTTEVDFSLS